MGIPRISIAGLMVAAIVLALDLAALRSVASRPDQLTGDLLAELCCALPMGNALALAAAVLVRGGRGGRFARGFILGGGMALAGLAAGAALDMDWLGAYLDFLVGLASRIAGRDVASAGEPFMSFGLLPVLTVTPQFLVALACGWASRRLACRSTSAPEPAPISRGRRLASRAALLILAAAPALAVEAYLRKDVDPLTARFESNSRAVFDYDASPYPGTLLIGYDPTRWPEWDSTLLPRRCEVRVAEDHEPSRLEVAWTDGGAYARDHRNVRVIVLDGPGWTRSILVPHHLLRPAR